MFNTITKAIYRKKMDYEIYERHTTLYEITTNKIMPSINCQPQIVKLHVWTRREAIFLFLKPNNLISDGTIWTLLLSHPNQSGPWTLYFPNLNSICIMQRILIRALIVQLSEKMLYRVRPLNGPLLWFWWRHGFAVVWSEKTLASRDTRFICRLLGQVIYTDYLHRWSDVIAHRFRLFKQIKLIGCRDLFWVIHN